MLIIASELRDFKSYLFFSIGKKTGLRINVPQRIMFCVEAIILLLLVMRTFVLFQKDCHKAFQIIIIIIIIK